MMNSRMPLANLHWQRKKGVKQLCVFGCSCYALDPRLQDGKKIPKWEPHAQARQFLGFLKEHSSKVCLV